MNSPVCSVVVRNDFKATCDGIQIEQRVVGVSVPVIVNSYCSSDSCEKSIERIIVNVEENKNLSNLYIRHG